MWVSENKTGMVSLNLKTANDLCLTSCLRFFASRHHAPLRIMLSFYLFIYLYRFFVESIFCGLFELTLLFSKLQHTKTSKPNLFDPKYFFLRAVRIEQYLPVWNPILLTSPLSILSYLLVCAVWSLFFFFNSWGGIDVGIY